MTPTALEALYRAYYGLLVRYLARRTGDRDAAEDLAHEAFLRAAAREPTMGPRAWLFTIALNLLRDEHRASARRRRLAPAWADQTLADPPTSPDRAAEQADTAGRVRAVLAVLPDRSRRVLELALAGMDHDAIAAATGLARAGVPTTLSRARAQFRLQAGRTWEGRIAA